MVDGFLKRKKNLPVAIVVIQINKHIRNLRNQTLQNLALYRREVKEPVKHKHLNISQPGYSHRTTVNLTLENCERAQLICICFSELIPVQQFGVSCIN